MSEEKPLKEKIESLKKDGDLSLNAYIDETQKCFENDCKRSTVISLWSIFIFYLYNKIKIYGLRNFKKFVKEKKTKFEGNINQIYDLQKIKDKDLIYLCRELGFYDKNIENQLSNFLNTRNSCAHVAQLDITKYQLFSYIEQLCNYIKIIDELDFGIIHKPFFDKIKDMGEIELREIIPSLEFELLSLYVDQAIEEVMLITDLKERHLKKGYYRFLSIVIESRDKDEEKVDLFERIFNKVFTKSIPFEFEITENFSKILNYSAIKKLVLEKDYLDNLISIFVNSHSFITAKNNSRSLLLFKKNFNKDQLNTIANAYLSNNQIYQSTGSQVALKILFEENFPLLDMDLIIALEEKGLKINF
jgi:hypothetical protein